MKNYICCFFIITDFPRYTINFLNDEVVFVDKICEEARQKGGRYERFGPSLYIEDIKLLTDTPEDIAVACNRQRISDVKHLSISPSDSDHVRGIRIVEKIGCDFIKETSSPIGFYALPEVIDDLNHRIHDCFHYYGDVLHCYYRIKQIIVTHIVEICRKSYAYYSQLEKELDHILFAYDGMEIIV